jgi:hypothetical protein
MADKYIRNLNGVLTEKQALVESVGSGSAGEIPALDPTGRFDQSLMPVGIGPDVAKIEADEALAAGDFINVFNDDGTAKVRKADASTGGKQAHGYVLESATMGNLATVYFEGHNTSVTGATPGAVFLGTTAGAFQATAPTGSGQSVQRLGVAIAPDDINFERTLHYVLA